MEMAALALCGAADMTALIGAPMLLGRKAGGGLRPHDRSRRRDTQDNWTGGCHWLYSGAVPAEVISLVPLTHHLSPEIPNAPLCQLVLRQGS
jgi:hypothetical protein